MRACDSEALERRWGQPERLENYIKLQFPKVARMNANEAFELQGLVRTLGEWKAYLSRGIG